MNHDLFQAEESALLTASRTHVQDALDGAEYRTALGNLIGQFRRLVRESRRLIVHSDRQERELTTLNEQLQRLAEELEYKATHDSLTDALNRAAVIARTDAHLGHGPLSLVVLDIDHFKNINDRFGHPAGDAVIAELVVRLRACVPAGAEIGRVGGEEFTVLLPQIDVEDATLVAERMRMHVADYPFHTPDAYRVTASFGISRTEQGGTFEAAYGNADQALYQAKRAGRNTVRVAPLPSDGSISNPPSAEDCSSKSTENRTQLLESALAEILRSHVAPIALQSIRAPADRSEKKWFEVLLRPRQLDIGVAEVLNFAAKTGREAGLDQLILFSALRVLAQDRSIDLLCVNLCRTTCMDADFPNIVAARMSDLSVVGARLCVEFPETADTNADQVIQAMRRWRERGVTVAIDDVGSGTSILRPLLLDVVDIVKLDATVLKDVELARAGPVAERVRKTVAFLESLGVVVVFEGVETQEQASWLHSLPQAAAQGFAISQVTLHDFERAGGVLR